MPNSFYDGDDGEIRYYGHPAGASETRAVTALVDSYYKAAATGNGANACLLLDASLARALVEADVQAPGRSGRTDSTCAALLSKMFEHFPGRSSADFAAAEVVGVRVKGDEGLALLRLPSSEVRDMPVSREGGAWRIEAFLDSGLS